MNKQRLFHFVPLALAALLLAGLAGFYLLLPSYLEQRLIPGLAGRLGVEEVRGRVRRLGFFGIELAELTAGRPGEPALAIRTARLGFSLPGLLAGRLAGVEITGLRLRLLYRDGTLSIPGLEMPQTGGEEEPDLALPLDHLKIEGGELLLESGEQSLRFPFIVSAWQEGENIIAEAGLFPCGEKIFFRAQADPAAGEAAGSFRTEGFAAACLDTFPLVPPEMHPGGVIDLRGSVGLRLADWSVSRFTAEGKWRQPELVHGEVVYRAADQDRPLAVSASGTPAEWRLSIADFSLASPWQFAVPGLDMEVLNENGRFQGAGQFRLRLPAGPVGPVILQAPFELIGDLRGGYTPEGAWQLEVTSGVGGGQRAGFGLADMKLGFLPQAIFLSGKGLGGEGELQMKATLADLDGKTAAASLRAPEAVLTGRLETGGSPSVFAGELAVDLSGLRAEAGETAVTIGRAGWLGDVAAAGEEYRIRGVLRLADSGAGFPGLELQAKGIAAEVPMAWPPPADGPQGKVTVADLAWAGKSMGPVTVALNQEGRGYRFNIVHANRLLNGLQAKAAGTVSWKKEGLAVAARLAVPPHELKGVELGRLSPAAAGLTLAGGVEAAGDFAMASGGAAGRLRAVLSRGLIEEPQKKWRIEGIETVFTLPALPGLQSGPAQLLFDRVALGDLLFGAGRLGYRLEESGALLVKEGEVAWAGGRLRLEGLRLAPGKEEQDLVIACEEVRIPEILAQFGVPGVEGEGAVSGRVPLVIRGGELRFGEGYLASPPGRGGFLKMKDPARLADAIPEAARAGQVDFAMEALRHFEYDQVKLEFGSQGEELILKMRLDGRPAEPLPFTFDRQLGTFVRLQGEGSAGIMQPMLLDLNFRLPLDELLHYGTGFQKLFEN